jgi:1,4-dihydroxy-2-naphthoate octaprenyltransferase
MRERFIDLRVLLREGIKPWFLVFGFLYYGLGVSIAGYLGYSPDWADAILGMGYLWMLQLATYLLSFYFNHQYYLWRGDGESEDAVTLKQEIADRRQLFLVAIQAGLVCLAVSALFAALLLINGNVDLRLGVFMLLAFLLGLVLAVPPINALHSGYGEFIQAVWIAVLFPGIGFLLQYGDLHRMLAMLSFPLAALLFAALIALTLPDYARDLKRERITLAIRMGWRNAMWLHNIVILVGFLAVGSLSLFGLPWKLLWPGLLPLPFGLAQIWTVERIASGRKPPWKLLRFLSLVTVCLTVYLLIFSLWFEY